MTPKKIVLALSGALIIALTAMFFFSADEKDDIKALFDRVAATIGKEAGENAIAGMAKIKSLRLFFIEQCWVDAPVYRLNQAMTFDEIAAFVFKERAAYKQITMRFQRFLIDIKKQNEAMVNVAAGFAGKTTGGGRVEDVHQLSCRLLKKDGEWRIEQIQVVEVTDAFHND